MNKTVKALSVEQVTQQISDHIAAYLDGGPNRKAEDVELAEAVGLKVERISARWDDAEDYLLLTPPRPEPLKAAEELATLTALKSADGPLTVLPAKDEKPKRRSLAPDPSEEAAKAE